MARIITRELAEKIRDKLCDVNMTRPNSVHDVWGISYGNKIVGRVSIRRGSEKDKGHDHIPREINVSTGFAKQIGICTKDLADYLNCLRNKGLISEPAEPRQALELDPPPSDHES